MTQSIDYGINKSNLSEIIAERIEQMILDDTTQINKKLPSEQTLASGFNVSRSVIREALTILKARGLVNQHQGDGSYIIKPKMKQISECMNRVVIMNKISLDEIFTARITLELGLVGMAAERATLDEISKLRQINSRLQNEKDDEDLRVDLDIRFHDQIAQMGGNLLLETFLNSLHTCLRPVMKASISQPGSDDDGYYFHKKIIEAIEQHDAEKARDKMRQHLILSMRNTEASIEKE